MLLLQSTGLFYGCRLSHFFFLSGQFHVHKVTPQADGSSSKVKVKVRVNVHGIFSVSSASLVEVHKTDESEEPMETDQTAKEEEVFLHILFFFLYLNVVQKQVMYILFTCFCMFFSRKCKLI